MKTINPRRMRELTTKKTTISGILLCILMLCGVTEKIEYSM
jgi:hypothetical protein